MHVLRIRVKYTHEKSMSLYASVYGIYANRKQCKKVNPSSKRFERTLTFLEIDFLILIRTFLKTFSLKSSRNFHLSKNLHFGEFFFLIFNFLRNFFRTKQNSKMLFQIRQKLNCLLCNN